MTKLESNCKKNQGTAVVLLWVLLPLVVFFFYWASIPRRQFVAPLGVPDFEIVQEGRISKVWLSQENGVDYANVLFETGNSRKCTLSTTGLYISASGRAEATIGRISTNEDEPSWRYTAMDVGLEKSDYWHLRHAGWPMFGNKTSVIIMTDN